MSRSKQSKVIQASNPREGVRTGGTLYFGSRESQTMLRVYDKRLELQAKGREGAASYGVRWELEFKHDRGQACAKALLALDPEDWRAFLVDVLRSYVDFLEPTREAESFEKYPAPLMSWWETLTEERRRNRIATSPRRSGNVENRSSSLTRRVARSEDSGDRTIMDGDER